MKAIAGQKLRQARERRSLSLEQVAQATRIRAHYLQALEAGEFDALPSQAQARGFLRAYAGYLGMDGEALLAEADGIEKIPAPAAISPPTTPIPAVPVAKAPAAAAPEIEPAAVKNTAAAKDTAELKNTLPVEETAAEEAPAPSSQVETASASLAQQQRQQTQPIFTEIGLQLRRQRELLGLSLDDIERHTHLRRHYLQFLEAGDLDSLPSPVQGRGMLNNYANFLGLDAEPLLLRFAEGLQTRLAVRKDAETPASPKPAPRKSRLPAPVRRLISIDVLVGITLALFLVAFITWAAIRIFSMQTAQSPAATAPSIADVLLASPTASATPTLFLLTSTPALPPALLPQGTGVLEGGSLPAFDEGKVQIYISVRQRTWMSVSVDGSVEFEGRVIPGSAYTFVGISQVEVLTGSGSALQVYFNQSDLGVLGTFGQVVNRIYTLQGILTPTPTITPTPGPNTPAASTNTLPAPLQPAQTIAPALP